MLYGFFVGSHVVTTASNWRKPVALRDEVIVGLGQPIPWGYIHGIQPTKRPGTFLLRRYDGDLRLTVKPADREVFFALIEEKTGHQLYGANSFPSAVNNRSSFLCTNSFSRPRVISSRMPILVSFFSDVEAV